MSVVEDHAGARVGRIGAASAEAIQHLLGPGPANMWRELAHGAHSESAAITGRDVGIARGIEDQIAKRLDAIRAVAKAVQHFLCLRH